jgi:hypothetical protein
MYQNVNTYYCGRNVESVFAFSAILDSFGGKKLK